MTKISIEIRIEKSGIDKTVKAEFGLYSKSNGF